MAHVVYQLWVASSLVNGWVVQEERVADVIFFDGTKPLTWIWKQTPEGQWYHWRALYWQPGSSLNLALSDVV